MDINILSVLIVALGYFVLGFAWYSDGLFGKMWRKEMGMKNPPMDNMIKMTILGYLSMLVTIYVLALFIEMTGASTFGAGLVVGLYAWLGFIASIQVGNILWAGSTFKLFVINSAYYLISFGLAGGILAIW